MGSFIPFASTVITLVAIYAILTLSLNLKFGILGLVDLGIVGYFAVGAYTYVLITAPHPTSADYYQIGLGLPMWVGFLVAPLVTGLFAFLIGLPALRLSGDYLAIATYAAAEVIRALITNERWLTNGNVGFSGLARPFRDLFSSAEVYRYFYMALMLAVLFVVYYLLSRLQRSPYGRAIKSIRESEPVALSVGKRVASFRVKTFVVGGVLTGLAACLYVTYTSLVVPSVFTPGVTWTVWIALAIGGAGNYRGALLGTLVLVGVQELMRFIPASGDLAFIIAQMRFVFMGLILILIVRYRVKGILPEKPPVDGPVAAGELSAVTEAAVPGPGETETAA
jgi:branched-chain amino acid transport system permease protein